MCIYVLHIYTYYIHCSPPSHAHRSELMINLKLVTVKKQFNSDVLNSRYALLICIYTVQVNKVEE